MILFPAENLMRTAKAEEVNDDVPLENIEEVEEGYLITHGDMIHLANYIEELHTEIDNLESELMQTESDLELYKSQLEEERKLADQIIESQEETIELQENQINDLHAVIESQERQIDNYEDIIEEYESISEKHLERIRELEDRQWRRDIRSGLIGAGVTSTIALIAILTM